MGYFQVRYDSRVVHYDCRGFIRLATGRWDDCLSAKQVTAKSLSPALTISARKGKRQGDKKLSYAESAKYK